MKRIAILSRDVAIKIAAGEVIERPASVVKELVENSIDAGASEVRVELQAGGKTLIHISDNGHGMGREDALLCFERHSTSKVKEEADLSRISTLGFRGEALPSISAVSRMVLRTSDGMEANATQVERNGEELVRVMDIAFPRGTSVEVRDLFFNLPARRKFLRSDQAELGLIVRFMTLVALAYPGVNFTLTHGKRSLLNCPRVESLRERIFQLYGKSLLEKLMEVDHAEAENESRLYGFASRPPSGRSDKSHQYFFVNRRPVRDKILHAALNQAYRGFLEKDLSPEAFLFLSLPSSQVDVNVHPAKAEVRFRDSQFVFRLITRSLEQAMIQAKGIKEVFPAVREEPGGFKRKKAPEASLSKTPPILRHEEEGREALFTPSEERSILSPRVLGQFLETYIIACREDGILVIDQHNAHERVLYEKYKEINSKRTWPQRMPLIPLLFDLSPSQVLAFETNQSLLEESGFRIEFMGGQSYALREFPDILKTEEAVQTLFVLLEEVQGEEGSLVDKVRRILGTLACKTAVKAGQALSQEKMEYLVEELFRTSNSSLCPHGRPIVVRIERAQIEKGLKRGSN